MARGLRPQVHEHSRVDVPELVRGVGLKVTKARVAILSLLAHEHGPFTAEQLHDRLFASGTAVACDLVTIYRCLAKFEASGLISRCDFGDGSVRYEFRSTDHHHHHIICRLCKRVEPLPDCPVEDRGIRLPKIGFRDISHRLEFFGVCPACQELSTSHAE
jgi:Fur family transcriptional regulator, ferric uptake regulator